MKSLPSSLFISSRVQARADVSAEEALERTKAHLERLKQRVPRKKSGTVDNSTQDLHPQQKQSIALETLYGQYILQSANSLKQELKSRRLNNKGRKPDMARRLAQHDLALANINNTSENDLEPDIQKIPLLKDTAAAAFKENDDDTIPSALSKDSIDSFPYPVTFAGLPLSETAAKALHQAGFLYQPSPIQTASLPAMMDGESILLHAPTGSGKTVAYTLPVTEYYWQNNNANINDDMDGISVIVTPTRELATQVAGVASTLAPPGCVRLVAQPSNLSNDGSRDRSDRTTEGRGKPRIIVGSAKVIVASLYGNEKYPASPTPKPAALEFLKSIRILVLDEVDRLLVVQNKHVSSKKHEKPAAILAAAVARHTLGRAQIVAASATVGRPLRRELARVLGLPPPRGPRVIVATESIADAAQQGGGSNKKVPPASKNGGVPSSSRLVTIPDTVEHFIAALSSKDDENNSRGSASSGQLLIEAYRVVQEATREDPQVRVLLVLTRGFGISTQHVIGALQHFQCKPEPQSLLDALQENVDGTDRLMQKHQQVSGATGVGQSASGNDVTNESSDDRAANKSSLWVTGEDTIRGMHLDGLDLVIMVGRPRGPDEYTHIAGRTGRAGRHGKVVAVVSDEQANMLRGWETMLQMKWQTYKRE